MTPQESLIQLKEKFSHFLIRDDEVKPPQGLPTGVEEFDRALLWKGLPQGELSLFRGDIGTGALSIWLQTAAKVQVAGRWCAWMNSEWELFPAPPWTDRLRWEKMIVVEKPRTPDLFFWILQEMISSSLFGLIGCHLPDISLKNHQLIKLKSLARTYRVALVFITSVKTLAHPIYALVIECFRDSVVIHRALHRPSPRTLEGVLRYARPLSALLQGRRILLG